MEVRAGRNVRVLKWLTFAVALAFVALFAFSATLRLVYPYEVEWMEGSMIDHVIRVLHGLPIYTAPSVDFVSWLYPPAYYYAVAAVMRVVGEGFKAGRIVSVVSTLATSFIIAVLVRRVTRDAWLAFFGAALYLAAYHATGYYFDIARNDAFFVLTLLLACYTATLKSRAGLILTACVLTLAFFTKQQALFFGLAAIVWYFARSRREGSAFLLAYFVAMAACLIFANSVTDGWFAYYVFDIPSAKRADLSLPHALRVIPDYVLGSFAVTSVAAIALILPRGRAHAYWQGTTGLISLMWFGAILAGAMSLGNEGGYSNVMMPFAAFSAMMLPIALNDLSKSVKFAGFVWIALLLQFGQLAFDPTGEKMLFAGNRQRAGARAIVEKIAALPGDVYIPYHGYIGRQAGKPTHAHVLATMDVLRMNDSTARRLARDFDSAYTNRFSAVVLEESKTLDAVAPKHYQYIGKLIDVPNVGLTRVASDATRPNGLWIRDINSW